MPLEIHIEGDSGLVMKLHTKAVKGITVCLSKACFRNIKYELLEMLEHRQISRMMYTFNALNGIPAYSGVIEHKKLILKELLSASKKHGIKLKREDFRLKTKLERYKVFVNDKPLVKPYVKQRRSRLDERGRLRINTLEK